MKNFLYNTGYFLRETKTMLRMNLVSNIFSFLSTVLIFFILSMVISGWWISNQAVEAVQREAEINVYFDEGMSQNGILQLVDSIKGIDGVREARFVDANEAYSRMEEILGKEAAVMKFFDDNPFSPFIEVKIHLNEMESVLEKLAQTTGIEYVRDNREVLNQLRDIAGKLIFLGYLVVAAVSISTLVVISHIIRQGIYNNREQINTLRLLGAPEAFIAIPFILEGLLLTLCGGILSSVLAAFSLKYVYAQIAGPLPFIPLPPLEAVVPNMVMLVIALSALLGIAGSLFGLSSAKR